MTVISTMANALDDGGLTMRQKKGMTVGEAAFLLMRNGVLLSGVEVDGQKPSFRPFFDPDDVVEYARRIEEQVTAAKLRMDGGECG